MRSAAGPGPKPTLLCVANFPSNTGFAWDFIETLYARLARHLAERGVRTLVAYPLIEEEPRTLSGSPAVAVELPVRLDTPPGWGSFLRFIKHENVRALYLSDRPAWHPGYLLLRAAGVRTILVHDHSSGERTRPTGLKRVLKWLSRRVPGTMAHTVLTVSDFVRRRDMEVGLLPAHRVHTVWNSVEVSSCSVDRSAVRRRAGLPSDRPLVACASRAAREKGVDVLLRAFDAVVESLPAGRSRPFLVYMGDGPALEELRTLRDSLAGRDDILLTGYRDDAREILGAADLCVVPSRWAEAFGMAALEPMARGVPVVASDIGGLPEIVVDGETGRLVPPDDVAALAGALEELLEDTEELRRLGRKGRERALRHFDMDRQVERILAWLDVGVAEVERSRGLASVRGSERPS